MAVSASGGEPNAANVGCSATFASLDDGGAVVVGGGLNASECRLAFGRVLLCGSDDGCGRGWDIFEICVSGIDSRTEFHVELRGSLAKAESIIAIPFGAVSAGTGGFG